MAYTYSKIATYTVGSGGTTAINFINIPQTYTDLKLVISVRSDRAGVSSTGFMLSMINSDTATNYSRRWLLGDGSAAASASSTGASIIQVASINAATSTANTFSNFEMYIPNYTGSNYKSFSIDSAQEDNATSAIVFMTAGLWSNSSPINSLMLNANIGNIVQYSTAHLYGIKAEL